MERLYIDFVVKTVKDLYDNEFEGEDCDSIQIREWCRFYHEEDDMFPKLQNTLFNEGYFCMLDGSNTLMISKSDQYYNPFVIDMKDHFIRDDFEQYCSKIISELETKLEKINKVSEDIKRIGDIIIRIEHIPGNPGFKEAQKEFVEVVTRLKGEEDDTSDEINSYSKGEFLSEKRKKEIDEINDEQA